MTFGEFDGDADDDEAEDDGKKLLQSFVSGLKRTRFTEVAGESILEDEGEADIAGS